MNLTALWSFVSLPSELVNLTVVVGTPELHE